MSTRFSTSRPHSAKISHACISINHTLIPIHPCNKGWSHTSVTSEKTHVPCECVQFDIRNSRKKQMADVHFAAPFQNYHFFLGDRFQ
jgi:hypothetical protein